METANNIQHENLISRLSKVQKEILAYLVTTPQPIPHGDDTITVYHLPRTGDVIDALGRKRTPSNYAVVSRALSRLRARGLIFSYCGFLCWRGQGNGYAVNPDARVCVEAA